MTALYKKLDFERMASPGDKLGEEEPYRSVFRRDYARLIHSPAFRRLQRKTQLFPGDESDFFRNRLTHSLEVAQIAKSIAIRLNHLLRERMGKDGPQIDIDLVEVAGLAHDLGHPPFGHTGEEALNECMHRFGGFEGNAQTLRILTKLEKKQTLTPHTSRGSDFVEFANGKDLRCGLNLSFRTLASVLKYDNKIPLISDSPSVIKGYYASEESVVSRVKQAVLGSKYTKLESKNFAVVEMQIMDLADDIAYSTYDFEDAMKAGFGTPLDLLLQANYNEKLRDGVAKKLFKSKKGRAFPDQPSDQDKESLENLKSDILDTIMRMMESLLKVVESNFTLKEVKELIKSEVGRSDMFASASLSLKRLSDNIAQNGYLRSQFASDLVGKRIRAIDIDFDENLPALSQVKIDDKARFDIDVIKHMTFELHIRSTKLKLIEFRGKQIVKDIFDCFDDDKNGDLLPEDWRERLRLINEFPEASEMRKRLICDYISGMTDAYALQVYSRLKNSGASLLFTPT